MPRLTFNKCRTNFWLIIQSQKIYLKQAQHAAQQWNIVTSVYIHIIGPIK